MERVKQPSIVVMRDVDTSTSSPRRTCRSSACPLHRPVRPADAAAARRALRGQHRHTSTSCGGRASPASSSATATATSGQCQPVDALYPRSGSPDPPVATVPRRRSTRTAPSSRWSARSSRSCPAAGTSTPRLTVLYAPTWEGWGEDVTHSSLAHVGRARRGAARPPLRVMYRPHPRSGTATWPCGGRICRSWTCWGGRCHRAHHRTAHRRTGHGAADSARPSPRGRTRTGRSTPVTASSPAGPDLAPARDDRRPDPDVSVVTDFLAADRPTLVKPARDHADPPRCCSTRAGRPRRALSAAAPSASVRRGSPLVTGPARARTRSTGGSGA